MRPRSRRWVMSAMLAAGVLLPTTGCVGRLYRFRVEALANEGAPFPVPAERIWYEIGSGNPLLTGAEPEFQLAAACVKAALVPRAWSEATPEHPAEFRVLIDFAMHGPRYVIDEEFSHLVDPVYEKMVHIRARPVEVARGSEASDAWAVIVRAQDTSPDLVTYVPLLIAAAAEFMGTNQAEAQTVALRLNDPRVALVTSAQPP